MHFKSKLISINVVLHCKLVQQSYFEVHIFYTTVFFSHIYMI